MPRPSDKRVPLSAAISIVAGSMIGTGVFGTLGFQLAVLPSAFPVLLVWLLGGLIAICGAVNYAELASAFPQSGGEYNLLSRVYHPAAGFVSGWVSITVGFPAPVALSALLFGEYLLAGTGLHPADPQSVVRMLACGSIVLLSALHLVSVRFSGRVQTMTTALKVMLVAALAAAGFVAGAPTGESVSFLPQPGDGALLLTAAFPLSLVFVLYAYLGWNAACYISGEVGNPRRNVPMALFAGTAVVTLLYLLLNAAFLFSTPIDAMKGRPDAAAVAAHSIFGDIGGRLAAGLIAFGLLSTLSAMIWSGSRVAQAMGGDSQLLAPLGRETSRGVPWLAVLCQTLISLLMVLRLDAEFLFNCTVFSLQIMTMLTVWGVVHIRTFRPQVERPYRAWGYPWTTLLFLLVSGYTLAIQLQETREESFYGLVNLALGGMAWALARPRVTAEK